MKFKDTALNREGQHQLTVKANYNYDNILEETISDEFTITCIHKLEQNKSWNNIITSSKSINYSEIFTNDLLEIESLNIDDNNIVFNNENKTISIDISYLAEGTNKITMTFNQSNNFNV